MRLIYKQVKELKAHCPKCEKLLLGNNSINSPLRCPKCGIIVSILNQIGEYKFMEETK